MGLFIRVTPNSIIPIPGVEPGPKDGKSPILTARPYRMYAWFLKSAYKLLVLRLVRQSGIEPELTDWKSGILPLNYWR